MLDIGEGELLVLNYDEDSEESSLLIIDYQKNENVTPEIVLNSIRYGMTNTQIQGRSMCHGRDDEEIFVLDDKYGVVLMLDLRDLREAFERGDASFDTVTVVSLYHLRDPQGLGDDFKLVDVAFIKSTRQLLIADDKTDASRRFSRIYSCPFDGPVDGSSCEVWFREDYIKSIFIDAQSIEVDEKKKLV